MTAGEVFMQSARIADMLADLGLYPGYPENREALARRISEAGGIAEEELDALWIEARERGVVNIAGIVTKWLDDGRWRKLLEESRDAKRKRAARRLDTSEAPPPAHYAKTAEQTGAERVQRAGMNVSEFERDRRITVAIEHLHFGRMVVRGSTAGIQRPTAAELAAELGMTPEEFHAAVLDRAKRTADAAAAAAPASKPRALGALQLVADKPAEVETEREAITEESETSVDTATRHPLPNKHRLNPTPGPGNSVPDVWNQQLVEADRAWAERFSMFRFVDRQANKQALAGPEPRPWVERAIRTSADRIAGRNPKWSGRHADHRPRAK